MVPLFTASEASAAVKIEGSSDALLLTAEDSSIRDVLSALSAQFNLTYASMVELNGTIAGTYSGTLQSVLRRILDGYDYVALVSADRIELKVWASSGANAHPTALPPPPNLTAAANQVGPPAGPIPGPGPRQPPPPPPRGPDLANSGASRPYFSNYGAIRSSAAVASLLGSQRTGFSIGFAFEFGQPICFGVAGIGAISHGGDRVFDGKSV
jgi:hypothetical protein